MDNFIQQRPHPISRRDSATSINSSQHVFTQEIVVKINKIIKQLTSFLLGVPVFHKIYNNITAQENENQLNHKSDAQINALFNGVFQIDLAVRQFFHILSLIQKQVSQSFQQLVLKYSQAKQKSQHINQMQPSLNNLQTNIQNLLSVSLSKQAQKHIQNKFSNELLEKQNKILKQNFKRLQQKYKHLLLQNKKIKEKETKESTHQSLFQDNYGIGRPSSSQAQYQPMRISVELLQKKLKEVQRQNAALRKYNHIDFMKLIEQLQRQIQMLRAEKNSNNKNSMQVQKRVGYQNYGSHSPYIPQYQPYEQERVDGRKTSTSRYSNKDKKLQDYVKYNIIRNKYEQKFNPQQIQRTRQRSVPAKLKSLPY